MFKHHNTKSPKILFFVIVACLVLVASCDKKEDSLTNPLDSIEIAIENVRTHISEDWLVNGDSFNLKIEDLAYSISNKNEPNNGVVLSYIQLEKDGKVIGLSKYTTDCTVSAKVDNWSHGENELKVVAVFVSSGKEIRKELCTDKVFVFNELPKYDIEGGVTVLFHIPGPDGTDLPYTPVIYSKNHIFTLVCPITVLLDNGENVRGTLDKKPFPLWPSFYIDESTTNFEAEITNSELHWRTPDGPSELPKDEEIGDNEILYCDFSIKGEHEGIKISKNSTTTFYFIVK